MSTPTDQPDRDLLAERLGADLRAISSDEAQPPGTSFARLDNRVLNRAQARLAGVGSQVHTRRYAAAAAVLLLAGGAAWLALPRSAPIDDGRVPTLAGDVNGDGRVDVIDAYLIARALREGEIIHIPTESLTTRAAGPGDPDSIMQRIVALNPSAPPIEGGGS